MLLFQSFERDFLCKSNTELSSRPQRLKEILQNALIIYYAMNVVSALTKFTVIEILFREIILLILYC